MSINVAIADDQKLFRKGMAALIASFEAMNVIFEAENGQELVDYCRQSEVKPDIVLLDLSMPVLNGLETLKIIKDEYPQMGVIILTIYEAENYVLSTIEAGANGYLAKNAEPAEVETAIREVAKNGFHFTVELLTLMRSGLIKKHHHSVLLKNENKLTKREREVLVLICRQLSSQEIAEKMFLSHRTVEGYRNNLLLKTESRNTAGLVVYALKHKIIDLSQFMQ